MTENPAEEVFEYHITVESGDIDILNHVNNTVYLRWVQEAAIAHWSHAASEEEKAEHLWIVSRHEIDYKYPALLGEELIAKTKVGKSEKIHFERLTDIVRKADGRVLATARTLWCPIDPATRRLKRVSEQTRKRFSVSWDI